LLDITDERVKMNKMAFEYVNDDSKIHWYRHYYTTDIDIEPVKNPLIRPKFCLPCGKEDPDKQYYEIIPKWTIKCLKEEANKHIDHFKYYEYLVYIDDRIDDNNVKYMKDVRSRSQEGEIGSMLIPQVSIEPMEEELLILLYDKLKQEILP
jgi:hypothetical protein